MGPVLKPERLVVLCLFALIAGGCSEERGGPTLPSIAAQVDVVPYESDAIWCGDERDDMIFEYYVYTYYWGSWRPTCDDFASGGGTGHFSWSELNGGFSTGNPHFPWGHIKPTLELGLELTRFMYNRGGIIINSGYRCPHGNHAVNGVTQSRHMYGDAVDMRSADHPWTKDEHDLLWEAAYYAGSTWRSTWGSYSGNHLHADWRP